MSYAKCYVVTRALALAHVLHAMEGTDLVNSDLILRHLHSTVRALTDLQLSSEDIEITLKEAEERWDEYHTYGLKWPYPSFIAKEVQKMDFETVGTEGESRDNGDN